jgi:hypothetical protein
LTVPFTHSEQRWAIVGPDAQRKTARIAPGLFVQKPSQTVPCLTSALTGFDNSNQLRRLSFRLPLACFPSGNEVFNIPQPDRTLRYPDPMDIANTLAGLRQERDQIEEAIISLERLVAGQGKRRGRPPGSRNTPKKSLSD